MTQTKSWLRILNAITIICFIFCTTLQMINYSASVMYYERGIGFNTWTQKIVYEETTPWASDDPPFKQYSNHQYAPSFNNPGKNEMIWVNSACDGIGKNITEPQNSVLNMYLDGSLPLVQYTPGEFSYMKLIAPTTGKRVNAQYDSIFNAMQKWQKKGLIELLHKEFSNERMN
jgi:hypothetical protein